MTLSPDGGIVRDCGVEDFSAIHRIINEAAEAYRGAIPTDCWHEPYMPEDELRSEMDAGVTFIGWELDGNLGAVMARQTVRDATLIRHAYVRPEFQSRGIGGMLLERLRAQAQGRLLVGTWADAVWAIRFYERHGFRMVPRDETTALLKTYWNVSDRQRDVSVVLDGSSIS